jgi:transposase
VKGQVSDLAQHAEAIKTDLTDQPVRTTAEAIERIAELTHIRRGPTQTRTFLAGLGFTWQRTRAVPVPPKKTCRNTWPTSAGFSMAS